MRPTFFPACLTQFLSENQESVRDFPAVTHKHKHTHACPRTRTRFFLLAVRSGAVATHCCSPHAAVFNGPVLIQCGLRPRIHPQFVCRMKACLAKQETFVGSQPSPPSLELENAAEQKQADGAGLQGRINAKNTQIEQLSLMSVWNMVTGRRKECVSRLESVAWLGLSWGPVNYSVGTLLRGEI